MANEAISKVTFGGRTLIDLTEDTVDAAHLLKDYTAHGADGKSVTGTCTYDADTSLDTVNVSEILSGKTAHARGNAMTGTMPNIGKEEKTISTVDGAATISRGYHDGTGSVTIATTEQAKIIAANIRQGITILGVPGSMSGTEDINLQNKSVTPTVAEQEVTFDSASNYNGLGTVTVAGIPYNETINTAGGLTADIG